MSSTTIDDITVIDEPVVIDYEPPVHTSWRKRHQETLIGIRTAIGIFAVSRALTTFCIYVGTALIPGRNMSESFLSWDSGWYYGVVRNGYPHVAWDPNIPDSAANTIAFFPLYPLIVRGLHNIAPLTILQSGIIVSLITGAIATAFLWLLARHLTSVATANKTVALFSFFPGSVAVLLMMSEGLMLALCIASMYFMFKRKWLLAGVLAALATATRPTAIVMFPAALWMAGYAIYKFRDYKAIITPIMTPLGILAYFSFLWHHTGDFMAWKTVEDKGWAYGYLGHFYGFKSFDIFFTDPLADLNASATAMGIIVAAVGLILLALWRPPMALALFALGIVALGIFSGGWGSKIRYMYSAFPFAIAAAYWARTELRFAALFSTSVVSLALYTILVTQTSWSIL